MSKKNAGGGARRPQPDVDSSFVLHEEEAEVGKRWEGVGQARFRREVVREQVRADFPLLREEVEHERVPVDENDSGQIETLPDGSISIPLFEEELVVTRQVVLRERVVIKKHDVTEWQTVEADLRRERLAVDTDDAPEGRVVETAAREETPRKRSRR